MSVKKCPKCGNEVEQNTGICPNCGYRFEEDVPSSQSEQTTNTRQAQAASGTAKKRSSVSYKTIRQFLIAGVFVFAVIATLFFFRAHNARTVYYNSSYSLSKNAYVGGDAYNYIINGTYFTGYSVIATGCMVSAVILGLGAVVISPEIKGMNKKD